MFDGCPSSVVCLWAISIQGKEYIPPPPPMPPFRSFEKFLEARRGQTTRNKVKEQDKFCVLACC